MRRKYPCEIGARREQSFAVCAPAVWTTVVPGVWSIDWKLLVRKIFFWKASVWKISSKPTRVTPHAKTSHTKKQSPIFANTFLWILTLLVLVLSTQGVFGAEITGDVFVQGEVIVIRTTPGAQGLEIAFANEQYRYLGELAPTIAFTPQILGQYLIIEIFPDGIETTTTFTVIAPPTSDPQPPKVTTPTTTTDEHTNIPPKAQPGNQPNTQSGNQSVHMIGNASIGVGTTSNSTPRMQWRESQREINDTATINSIIREPDQHTIGQGENGITENIDEQINTLIAQTGRRQAKEKFLESDERPIASLNSDLRLRTSQGTGWLARIDIREKGQTEKMRASTDDLGIRASDIGGSRKEVTFTLRDRHIKSIVIDDANLTNGVDIGVDDLAPSMVDETIVDRQWIATYAIDPSTVDFTSGSLTAIAEGEELYKCKDWIFSTRTCTGEWVKIMDLTPGEEYTVELSPVDPGFAEAIPTTGINPDASEGNITVMGSIPSIAETSVNEWGIVITNPTNRTITVFGINVTANQNIFSSITGVTPSSTWAVTSATLIRWTGVVNVTPMNSTQFIFRMGAQSGNRPNILISILVDTNETDMTNAGYLTHIQAASIPYPSVYLLNSSSGATYFVPQASEGAPNTFTIRVDNDAGLAVVETGSGLDVFFPPEWTNISVALQSGWTIGTVGGDEGSGFFIKPQTTSTTIGSGGTRDFSFSANAPYASDPRQYIFLSRLFGPSGSNTREISSTLEPTVRVTGASPLLENDDDRYMEIWTHGGSRTVDQYISVPAPFDSVGGNRWGIVVVNPHNHDVNVTQIDITTDQNVFNTVTGLMPTATWAVVSASNVRWNGTQTIPPRSAIEFATNVVATAASTTRVLVTSTTVTTNGTLVNTGFRTSQSTGNIQYPSIAWVNQSGQQSYLERNLTPGRNTQFTIRVNNTGSSAAVPLNTWLEIRLPPGWTNVTAATQTGWTIRQILNDNRSGALIRVIVATSTIGTGTARNFVFNATTPVPGTNSTYRIDARLIGATAQTTNSIIQSHSQLGARITVSRHGLNLTHGSDLIAEARNVSALSITSIARARNADIFNFTIYNWRLGTYETIVSGTVDTTEAMRNTTLLINRTFDPRDYLNTTVGASLHGLALVRWTSSTTNATALFQDVLNISFETDTTLPMINLTSPENGTYHPSANITLFYNATDNIDLRNCSLFINGAHNQTNSSPANSTGNNFTVRNLPDRTYNWSVGCYDLIGHYNSTGNRTFTIDTVNPRTFLFSPSSGTKFTNETVVLLFNVTEINLANCSLYVNNTLNQTNTSVVNSSNNPFGVTVSDGSYNWTIECLDRANNSHRNSTIREFSVDTTAPLGSAPTSELPSNSEYNQSQLYRFNATFTDANGISTVIFESNFSGTLINRTVNVSVDNIYSYNVSPIGAGFYVWRMYANDTYGNNGTLAQQQYIVDPTTSLMTLLLNGTDTNYPVDINESVNITAMLLIPTSGYMELYVNGTLFATGNNYIQNITSFNSSGSRNITIIYNATQNYSISSVTLFVTVGDRVGPIINRTYPGNHSFLNTPSITFLFNLSDATGLGNCSLFINGTFNATNTSELINEAENSMVGEFFSEGNYTWSLQCFDVIGNSRNTSNLTFAVDLTPPIAFANIAPVNETVSTDQSPSFSWTQSADLYFANYTLMIDNANDFSSPNYQYNRTGVTNTSITIPDAISANVIWYWRVVARDLAGNTYATVAHVYTVDTIPPIIDIIVPSNNTYQNITGVNITIDFSDLSNVTNCTVFVNDSTQYSNTSMNQTDPTTFLLTKVEGTYLFSILCEDQAGNTNTTEEYTLTIDTTPPTDVTLLTPANNTFSNDNTPFLSWTQTVEANFKNYTVLVSDDTNFPYLNFSYEVTNIATPEYQVISPWTDGTLYWKVIVWDLAGNSADPIHTYTIDSTPPTAFSLLLPPDGTSSTNRTPSLTWEQSNDTNFKNYTILVTDDSTFATIDHTYYVLNNTNTTFNVSVQWADNTIWQWRVIAIDTANNTQNSSQTFTYITDNQAPVVTLNAPSAGATINSNTSGLINFIFNVSDLSEIENCTLLINDSVTTTEITDYFITKNQNTTIIETLSTGEYNWSVMCSDEAGNTATAGPRSLSVNVTLPKILLYDTGSENNPALSPSGQYQAISVYASNTGAGLTIPRYRTWNGTNWSAETSMDSAGSNIRWVKVATNPLFGNYRETIATMVGDDGNIDAYVWNGSNWTTWNDIASIGTTSNADRSFDIEYETQRGRGVLVYSVNSTSGSQDLAYRIWNGSGWAPEQFINDPSFATDLRVGYIRIARNPANDSNALAIAYIDATNSDARTAIWNGTNWTNFLNITTAISITTEEAIGIAFEQESKHILAVAGTGSTVAWAHWNGSSWNATGTVDINTAATGATNYLSLKPNPEGNEIMIAGNDAGNDLSTALWTGNAWSATLRHDATVDGNAQRIFDFEWEQTGDAGLFAWGTSTGVFTWRTYSIGSSWGAINSPATSVNTHAWMILRRIPNPGSGIKILGASQKATSFQMDGQTWDGSAISIYQGLFSTSQAATTYQRFDIVADSYQTIDHRYTNATLNGTIDNVENIMTATGSGLQMLSNMTSLRFSNYTALGFYLPSGSRIRFVNILEATNPGVSFATFVAYKINSSGEHLLCRRGNFTRTTNDNEITATALHQRNASCITTSDTRILPEDQVRVYTYINSSANNTITKHIDTLESYVEIEGYRLGLLTIQLIVPQNDPLIGEGENVTMICQANCTNGFCLNLRVTAEINTTIDDFTAIDYFSGNIILNQSATNPSILGTINSTTNATFALIGELYSLNNTLTCNATSDWINVTGNLRNVTVLDKIPPNITLISPDDGGGFEPSLFTFIFNASDRRLGNCSLWGNWSGTWEVNQTIAPNNGSPTSFEPINISEYGTYKWNVNCSDLAGNDAYAPTNFTFTIAGDLAINTSGIIFFPSEPVEGASMIIYADILNLANRDEANFNVSFWLGDPLIDGVQIGPNITVSLLQGLSNITVNVTYNPPIGASNIFVIVDPPYLSSYVFESDEENNIGNRTLFVSMWQVYYGNATGNVTLGDSLNATLVSWAVLNQSGNLYVSDTDTSNGINFLLLKAMGRNTTSGRNVNTNNDFEEIDTEISATLLEDNVNTTFTQNGDPLQTQTFTIFSTNLLNVPVINSTQSGNFTTGLLWDADDSTNAYYDSTDQEDIVFVAQVKQSINSTYGYVDYEIRVPSRLQDYKGSTPTVTFYYEIQ